MRLLVLQHIACEHPGAFTQVIEERGVDAIAVELDEGEPLPDWREFDAVLAMGGPMGAVDDRDHPWLAAERELIAAAVAAGRPVLGVCLGAQLIAAALGAGVMPCERPEVGLLEVELTEEGRADPLFAGLEGPMRSLQWHGDTFELPEGATLLARSAEVANQAFRVDDRTYGVQFHLEVTAEMAREWAGIPAYADSLSATLGERRAAAFIANVERRAHELHPPARKLFGNWLELAGTPRSGSPRALYNFVH